MTTPRDPRPLPDGTGTDPLGSLFDDAGQQDLGALFTDGSVGASGTETRTETRTESHDVHGSVGSAAGASPFGAPPTGAAPGAGDGTGSYANWAGPQPAGAGPQPVPQHRTPHRDPAAANPYAQRSPANAAPAPSAHGRADAPTSAAAPRTTGTGQQAAGRAGRSLAADGGKGAAGTAAGQVMPAKKPTDTTMQSGIGKEAEARTRQAAATAAKAAAVAYTGSTALGTVAEKVTDKVVKHTAQAGVKVARAAASVSVFAWLVVVSLVGGTAMVSVGATLNSRGGGWNLPPKPTAELCAMMPAGWCEAMYKAQENTTRNDVPVPWPVVAGVAAVNTDFGRRSPYDELPRNASEQVQVPEGGVGAPPPGAQGRAEAAPATAAPAAVAPAVGPAPATAPERAGRSKCADLVIAPAIGGGEAEAAGPFLLLPEQARKMRDRGKDPQGVCASADVVAQALSRTAAQLLEKDDTLENWDEDADSYRKLWETAIASANVVSDRNGDVGDCARRGPQDATASQLIDLIWRCELQRAAGALQVATALSGDTFETLTGQAAVEQLLNEAHAVAHHSSGYGSQPCAPTAATAGVFPLTAAAASRKGVADRCIPRDNIAAAARIVIDGESVPVGSRPRTQPFQPMLGGWAAIPAALGPDNVLLPQNGPVVDWASSEECDAAISAWLAKLATPGSQFVDAASETADQKTFTSAAAAVPSPQATPQCAGGTTRSFAERAKLLAEDLRNATGAAPVQGAAEAAPPTPGLIAPKAPQAPTAIAAFDAAAMLGVANHMSWVAQEHSPAPAAYGTASLVSRLSTTGAAVTTPPGDRLAVGTVTGDQTSALDWALSLGGTPTADGEYVDAGVAVGSLKAAVGMSAGVGAASGNARVVIDAALQWLGTPYSWGGGTPAGPGRGFAQGANTIGFDCSSLTQYAYDKVGIRLGRTTRDQIHQGQEVAGGLAAALPGDLFYWASNGRAYHTAIYLGDGNMVHAPKTGDVVKIVKVSAYGKQPSNIRRHLQPEAATVGAGGGPTTLNWSALPPGGQRFTGLFEQVGRKHNVDPRLVAAIAWQESNFIDANINCSNRSSAGAMGLMQFMPGTAQGFGINACDPAQAADAGAQYIRQLVAARGGNLEHGLASYNWGGGNVNKWLRGEKSLPAETRNYVTQVPQKCRTLGGCQG